MSTNFVAYIRLWELIKSMSRFKGGWSMVWKAALKCQSMVFLSGNAGKVLFSTQTLTP